MRLPVLSGLIATYMTRRSVGGRATLNMVHSPPGASHTWYVQPGPYFKRDSFMLLAGLVDGALCKVHGQKHGGLSCKDMQDHVM